MCVPKGRYREEQKEDDGWGWFPFVNYQSGPEYKLSAAPACSGHRTYHFINYCIALISLCVSSTQHNALLIKETR